MLEEQLARQASLEDSPEKTHLLDELGEGYSVGLLVSVVSISKI
jgi:hypothetical protein